MSPTVLDCASIRQLSSPAASRSIKACRENYFINFAGRKPATNEKVPSITPPPLPIYQITLTKKSTQIHHHLDLAVVLKEFTPFRLSHTITALPQTSDAALNILLPQPQTLLTRFFIPKCLISRFSRLKIAAAKNRRTDSAMRRTFSRPFLFRLSGLGQDLGGWFRRGWGVKPNLSQFRWCFAAVWRV